MRRLHIIAGMGALLIASALSAQQPAPKATPLTPAQQERLKAAKLRQEGKLAEAAALLEKVLAIERGTLGAVHLDLAASHQLLAEIREEKEDLPAARDARNQVLVIRTKLLGPDHWQTIDARVELDYSILLGKLKPGERQRLRESDRLMDQANASNSKGLKREALEHAAKVVAIRKEVLGDKQVRTAVAMALAGFLSFESGDRAKAEPLLLQALETRKQVLGEKHPDFAASLTHLAGFYKEQADYARAEPLYRQALEINKQALGEKSLPYAFSLNNLATLHLSQGDYAKAEPLLRQALEIRKQVLGEKPCSTSPRETTARPNRSSVKPWRFANRCWAKSIPPMPPT